MGEGATIALFIALGCAVSCAGAQSRYFGRELGALSELHHGVRGRVYAVDARTLYLKDFTYDGEGPAAYFYVGTSKTPSATGATRLRDERGGTGPLRRYRGEGVTLALPDGTTLKDVKWFSVWCDEYSVNFGDVSIPRELDYPRPARLGALRGVHGVSSDPVVVVDAQTLLVPNFSYDGEAPDAKFWVGRGEKPSPAGIRIPDENGKETPLRRYEKKTIVLTLPGELTVFDVGHFAVWCEAFTVNFGHVVLPRAALANVPPSLKMLGVSPQSKLNCEVLLDELAFEVRWAVAGDSIVLQLVAKLEEGEYMSFGISGSSTHSQMVGADVAVAWVDKHTLKGYAQDYYLDAKSQCAGVRGSCPDERLGEKTNSIRLLNAALVNGYSIVTYQRSLRAADDLDRPVLINGSQPIVWALGPLNSRDEVSYHHHFTKGDKFIEFGRPPVWNCPMPESEEQKDPAAQASQAPPPRAPAHEHDDHGMIIKPNPVPTPKPAAKAVPWDIPAIQCYEPPDGVFYAQMGPTGGKQGYPAITGHVGWGISWYVNGLLIPEINLVRGKRYTFVVEGGNDPEQPARYHPFYITNDSVGGYFHKTEEEKKGVEIYAGVRRHRNGELVPTGVGRLCNWTPDTSGPEADEFPSFGAYQRSLTLVCDEGNPGVVTFTPDKNTPDIVYYQCFTHRYLGWKINVLDACDAEPEGEESQAAPVVALPPSDLLQQESIQVHSRVKPDSNVIDNLKKMEKIMNTKTASNNFSSNKNTYGLTGEVYGPESGRPHRTEVDSPVSKGQIRDVIEVVENLESKMKENMRRNMTTMHGPNLRPHHKHQPHPLHTYQHQMPHPQHQMLHLPPQQNQPQIQHKFQDQQQQSTQDHNYQVYEDVKESFLPEQPVREGDEYTFESGKLPETFFLPHNQKPLTLQSVLRPNGPNKPPPGKPKPNYRRPVPPEIKLRRPMPNKPNFPLPVPNSHGSHVPMGPPKKVYMKPFNRMPPNAGRPMSSSLPGAPNGTPMGTPIGIQSGIAPVKPHSQAPPSPLKQHHHKSNFGPSPPKQMVKVPMASGPVQSIIMGKPHVGNVQLPSHSQTLSLGHTDLIANQVVKSHIILPANSDSLTQSSVPQTYVNQPGQIILGKPMDNPVPLDQQMSPARTSVAARPLSPQNPPSRTPTIVLPVSTDSPTSDIKSSDFLGESSDTATLTAAVNTGFKPNTIVIESGFKPIIREPLMDRVGDYDDGSSNRREDTDVEEDYIQAPQVISNHAYQTPSDKMTESFEPMFIPSPEDHLIENIDRTKEVFPSNHAKEDRPHPVYVKSESELNALFSKQNMEKVIPSDMVMESDRVSPQYLPPDPKLPKEQSQKLLVPEETFTTYDGKTVSAATLTGSVADDKAKTPTKLYSAKRPSNTELLLKSPQFGPFKGDIPPPVDEIVSKIKNDDKKSDVDNRTTHLKLINAYKPEEESEIDPLKAEGSENHEIKEEIKKKDTEEEEEEEYDDDDEDEDEDEEQDEGRSRSKRDTKTTQFENSQSDTNKTTESSTEFNTNTANTPNFYCTLLLLTLCLNLF